MNQNMKSNMIEQEMEKTRYLSVYGFYPSFCGTWRQQDSEDDSFFTFVDVLNKEVTFLFYEELKINLVIRKTEDIEIPKEVNIYDEMDFITWLCEEERKIRKKYNI